MFSARDQHAGFKYVDFFLPGSSSR